MHSFVYGSEDEDEQPDGDFHAPYPLATCFSLWVAFKDKGTLPHGGGMLDQPRWWQRMIDEFNRRYAPVYEQWLDEQKHSGGRETQDDDPYRWLVEDGGQAATGWEALKGSP